ncbi:MAG: DNA-3-methyladenine glycosylase I [Verrucomicrobiota bacterium JB023]|nr:DNA-3-methyladenine glycosylase I [Verrucomicrobiota bacterium JB023]
MPTTELPAGLSRGPDGLPRCGWCQQSDDYRDYHDLEWGKAQYDDHRLFEKIVLEGFQSGLSWLTILRKREHFRAAFANFDFQQLAHFGENEVALLLENPGIVRHRRKIESAINNARRACELVESEGSLADFLWTFQPTPAERPARCDYASLQKITVTESSSRLAKELKKRGWSFIGPTTAYAFMQACGMVNDHLEGCAFRDKC